jgi:hypothetical protein
VIDSLFLAVASGGLASSGMRGMLNSLLLAGFSVASVGAAFFVLIAIDAPLHIIFVYACISRWILASTLLALMIVSTWGWVGFFRGAKRARS